MTGAHSSSLLQEKLCLDAKAANLVQRLPVHHGIVGISGEHRALGEPGAHFREFQAIVFLPFDG